MINATLSITDAQLIELMMSQMSYDQVIRFVKMLDTELDNEEFTDELKHYFVGKAGDQNLLCWAESQGLPRCEKSE